MNRRPTHALLLLPFLLAAALAARAQDAVVIFKDKRSWEVELTGATNAGVMKMRMKNSSTDAETPVADIALIRFAVPFDENEVQKNYTFGDYEKVNAVLADKLRPYFYYLAFENNITPYTLILARTQYWLEKYSEASATADKILRSVVKESREWTEASLIKCLCLHAQNKSPETARILSTLPAIERDDAVAPIYWYSLARLHMTTNNVREATENIANIVAFAAKDFDWMPPALYQSAEFHLQAHRFEAATQICNEMQVCAKDTPWQQKASDLIPRIAKAKTDWEAQQKKAAQAAAEKAARSPLRPQPGAESPIDTLLKEQKEGNP